MNTGSTEFCHLASNVPGTRFLYGETQATIDFPGVGLRLAAQ